ncbi:alpha/beta fold hydrolase [Derxia lacustris]|uniref:alpha/beta fold hydrolase n=1 Tax=Derxia lacustris TaxID=764842 RepID=UPI000A16DD40|nr:alpha/beta hydrolase [Derxia lacustris]
MTPSRSRFLDLRGLRIHLREWGPADGRPLVLLHGFLDVSASFQFLVDAFAHERRCIALDWRGFGLSQHATDQPAVQSYWFPDYLADLDALLDRIAPDAPVHLLGHSMGGLIAALYAAARPARIRSASLLEGFGPPATVPTEAPRRYARWLDQLRHATPWGRYASLDEVAGRIRRNHPQLGAERARWLAEHWAAPEPDGTFALRADRAHRLANPTLFRREEAEACWVAIECPVLWISASAGQARGDAEMASRGASLGNATRLEIAGAGHMVHIEAPEACAAAIDGFIARVEAQENTP